MNHSAFWITLTIHDFKLMKQESKAFSFLIILTRYYLCYKKIQTSITWHAVFLNVSVLNWIIFYLHTTEACVQIMDTHNRYELQYFKGQSPLFIANLNGLARLAFVLTTFNHKYSNQNLNKLFKPACWV